MIKRVTVLALAVCLVVVCSHGEDMRHVAQRTRKPILMFCHGSDWCAAGEAVLKTWKSNICASTFRRQFNLCEYDAREEMTKEQRRKREPMESLVFQHRAFPAIIMYTSQGECCGILRNIPHDVTAQELIADVDAMNERRKAVEELRDKAMKEKNDAAVEIGASALDLLRKEIPTSILLGDKGFKKLWEHMTAQDPEDVLGWRAYFTFDPMNAGIAFAEFAKTAKPDALLERLEELMPSTAKPRWLHLTTEQRQGLLFMPFIADRLRPGLVPDFNRAMCLRSIVDEDPRSVFGQAALFWLSEGGGTNMPVSTYFGWHAGDFSAPTFDVTVTIGVADALRDAGTYTVTFDRGHQPGVMTIDTLYVLRGAGVEDIAVKIEHPVVRKRGNSLSFTFDWKPDYEYEATAFRVVGACDETAASLGGDILVKRHREVTP